MLLGAWSSWGAGRAVPMCTTHTYRTCRLVASLDVQLEQSAASISAAECKSLGLSSSLMSTWRRGAVNTTRRRGHDASVSTMSAAPARRTALLTSHTPADPGSVLIWPRSGAHGPRRFRARELARKRWGIAPCRRRALAICDCPGRLRPYRTRQRNLGWRPTTPRHRKPQLPAKRRGRVTRYALARTTRQCQGPAPIGPGTGIGRRRRPHMCTTRRSSGPS